jgi:GPH family glycoside/pentoside/hexuronide:cation symporter
MTQSANSSVYNQNFNTGTSTNKLPVLEKIGYSLGDAASNLYFGIFMTFLPIFYTDVFGLSAAAMGWMFLITKIWDAVNDPIMGMISDRTETRWGKFRPYIISMAPFLAICGVFTFFTPGFGDSGKLIYAYVTYTLVLMLYTAANVPYSALMGVMSPSSLERTSASQYRFISAFIGQSIVSGATLYLVGFFGNGNDQAGWMRTAGAYGILAFVLLAITFFSTKERVHVPKTQKTNTIQDLKDLFQNVPWVLIGIATFFQLVFIVMRSSSVTYFFKYYVLDQQLTIFNYTTDLTVGSFTSYFLLIGNIAGLLGAIYAKSFAKTVDKKNAYSGALIASSIISCCFYFVQPHNVLIIFSLSVIGGFLLGAVSVLQWAIYTDTADYGEWKFGRRSTGLIMAASLFALKLGLAFGQSCMAWIIAYYGYVDNAPQTEYTIYGIRMLMSFYPAVFGIIGGLIMVFYPLKNRDLLQIEKDLSERRVEA